MKIKTIDITAREWFDRANGNSYFSARAIVNYGMPNAQTVKVPFQYGYGDHYIEQSAQALESAGLINPQHYENGSTEALWQYCQRNRIILRTSKEKTLKRDCKAFAA